MAMCFFLASVESLGQATAPSVCTSSKLNVSVAYADSSTGIVVARAELPEISEGKGSSNVEVPTHIALRNDGSGSLSRLCLTARFWDHNDRVVPIRFSFGGINSIQALACVDKVLAPNEPDKSSGDLPLVFVFPAEALPVSGSIAITASGDVPVEQPSAGTKNSTGSQANSGGEHSATCRLYSKVITRSYAVGPVSPSLYLSWVLGYSALVAVIFLVACAIWFRKHLSATMGAPRWDFNSSWATNVTVVGGILTLLLSSGLLPEYPHYMSKQSYTFLGVIFSVLILLAPAIYKFSCTPQMATDPSGNSQVEYQGVVFTFLLVSSLTSYAVMGQLATAGFLFAEFQAKNLISSRIAFGCSIVLIVAGLSLLLYCFKATRFNVQPQTSTAPQGLKKSLSMVFWPADHVLGTKAEAKPRWNVF